MHRFRGVAVVLALAACAASDVAYAYRSVRPPVAAPEPAPSAEREIYALLVAHAFADDPPDTLLLAARSPAYRDLPADNFLRRGKVVVPPPLPARLRVLSAGRPPIEVGAFLQPVRVVPMEPSERAVFLAVTPVAFAHDSAQALVYYDVRCGALRGHGIELWLIRGPDGRWRVRQALTHWVP